MAPSITIIHACRLRRFSHADIELVQGARHINTPSCPTVSFKSNPFLTTDDRRTRLNQFALVLEANRNKHCTYESIVSVGYIFWDNFSSRALTTTFAECATGVPPSRHAPHDFSGELNALTIVYDSRESTTAHINAPSSSATRELELRAESRAASTVRFSV